MRTTLPIRQIIAHVRYTLGSRLGVYAQNR